MPRKNWIVFDEGYFCRNCDFTFIKQNYQFRSKILRQNHSFSIKLPFAPKKTRKLYHAMVNTQCNSTQDKIDNLQSSKGKTTLKKYQNISKKYDEIIYRRRSGTFQLGEDRLLKMQKELVKLIIMYYFF